MVIAFSFICGAFSMAILLFVAAKYAPGRSDTFYKDKHLEIIEKQLSVFNERMVEERRLANALEIIVAQFTPTNSAMLKLPTIEECYRAIPFPSDERECAMFVAGIAECHKFVGRQLQQ